MEIDIFKDLLVPVIGGLGIFMLGLEFMSDGINNLAANRMRAWLAKLAGTPVKGLAAGTVITGVLQSSTAMTVMVVGLVNAGVVGLRPAISVIMGANIGTTLGNGLIAMPLGPLGLIFAGLFALVYVFSKNEKTRNIALAIIGFSLIFYGLNLLTGGLKPLRGLPEVMSVISGLQADSYGGLAICVLTAAGITAMIHSSSATIGIVMGLGAAGILDWQTAVAFSLGADLGTTVTSWLASLNLSKNAKRAAYVLPVHGHPAMDDGPGRHGCDPLGNGRRQGKLPLGTGGGRAVFHRFQHLQYGADVPLHRGVRPRAVAHRRQPQRRGRLRRPAFSRPRRAG
jgi:phosphate:Na+ symporter